MTRGGTRLWIAATAIAASAVIGSAQVVILVDHSAPPDSLAGYVQRSQAIVLGQVTNSVQKRAADIPTPYIDHEVKILRVIKDDGIVGKHKTIQVSQSAGVAVIQGVTYSVEPKDKAFNIQDELILFLVAKSAGATAYSLALNLPYAAFHVGKAIDKSDVVQIPARLPEFDGATTMALDKAISKLKSAVNAGRGKNAPSDRRQVLKNPQ